MAKNVNEEVLDRMMEYDSKHHVNKVDNLFGLFKIQGLKVIGNVLNEIKTDGEVTGKYTTLMLSSLDGTRCFKVTGSEYLHNLLNVWSDYSFGFDINDKSQVKIVSYCEYIQ